MGAAWIERWLKGHVHRNELCCGNANHSHDVVSNVVNVSTFLLCTQVTASESALLRVAGLGCQHKLIELFPRNIPAYYSARRIVLTRENRCAQNATDLKRQHLNGLKSKLKTENKSPF
jgi:hypothetical protein